MSKLIYLIAAPIFTVVLAFGFLAEIGANPASATTTTGISLSGPCNLTTETCTFTVGESADLTITSTTTTSLVTSTNISSSVNLFGPGGEVFGQLPDIFGSNNSGISWSATSLTGVGSLTGTPLDGSEDSNLEPSYSMSATAVQPGVGEVASLSFTIVIDESPTITGANAETFTVGTNSSVTVGSTGYPAPTFDTIASSALPTDVAFSSSGILSGTPSTGDGGSYPLTLTASNGVGSDAQENFTLIVDEAPTITGPNTLNCTTGQACPLQTGASGYPTSFAFSANPSPSPLDTLPTGMTITSSGLISGTPTAVGTYDVELGVINGISPAGEQTLTITVTTPIVSVPTSTTTSTPPTSPPDPSSTTGATSTSSVGPTIIPSATVSGTSSTVLPAPVVASLPKPKETAGQSRASAKIGTKVTFSVHLVSKHAGVVPSGTVRASTVRRVKVKSTIRLETALLGSAKLSKGRAVINATTSALSPGRYTVTISYGGDAKNAKTSIKKVLVVLG